MAGHGLPESVFQEVGQTFKVTFTGPEENILDLIPEEGVTNLRSVGLNARQIEALRLMVKEGRKLTNRDYRRLFAVGNQTAAKELMELVEKEQARRLGAGRATLYEAS